MFQIIYDIRMNLEGIRSELNEHNSNIIDSCSWYFDDIERSLDEMQRRVL